MGSAVGARGISVSMTGMSGFFNLHFGVENKAGPKTSDCGDRCEQMRGSLPVAVTNLGIQSML